MLANLSGNKDNTTIVEGAGSKEAIDARVHLIKKQIGKQRLILIVKITRTFS